MRSDPIERRQFIRLLALTGALAAAQPKPLAAAASRVPDASAKARRPRSAALQKELESQKKSLLETLRVVRSHELPAGSPPASVFRPLRSRGRERT
jgi:hypothetical protein